MANFPYSSVQEPDVPLSNLAVAYEQKGLIADIVCPRVPVTLHGGQYYKRRKRDMIQVTDDRMGVNGSPGEINGGYDLGRFACEDYGLKEKVMRSVTRAADPSINPFADATKRVTSQVMTNHEVRVAAAYQTSSNYASNNYAALSGSDRWDTTTGDPISKVLTIKKYLWRGPQARTVAWMGYEVFVKLRTNPFIKEALGSSCTPDVPAAVTLKGLASLFMVDEVVIGEAWKDTGVVGSTSNEALIWGKSFGIAAVEASPTLQSLHFASCMSFQDRKVFTWADPEPGLEGADWVKVTQSNDIEFVASDGGIFLATVIT